MNRDWRGRFVASHYHDPLDPTTWEESIPYRPLYLSERDDMLFCLLDARDWEWASAHLWHPAKNSWGKIYAARTSREGGVKQTIWLHKEVLKRHRIPKSDLHSIGDHKNGDGLDDRLENLRWATLEQNNRNKLGSWYRQLRLFGEEAA